MRGRPFLCALALAASQACAASDTSAAAEVFVDTTSSCMWNTGKSQSFSLPIEYPVLASAVDVYVKGVRYSASETGVTAASLPVSLPEPSADAAENVYEITLAFNDGTTNKCAFALVRSQSLGASCPVRLTSESSWSKIEAKRVVQVPAGYEPQIDGQGVAACSNGGWGWFACPRLAAGEHEFTLFGPDGEISLVMDFLVPGFLMSIK